MMEPEQSIVYTTYCLSKSKAGETSFVWALQNEALPNPVADRIILPQWMSAVLQLRVSKFSIEHDRWERKIAERAAMGRALTASQRQKYDQWQSDCVQKIAFNKKRQICVTESRSVTKDCIAVLLHLSDQPDQLTLCSACGQDPVVFRLLLLRTDKIGCADSTSVPSELDQPISKELQTALADEENTDVGERGETHMSEAEARELDDQRLAAEAGEVELKAPGEEDFFLLASDDEEWGEETCINQDLKIKKVKDFFLRPAWQQLQKLGLCELPRHITGCSIGYHKTSRQWEGFYPKSKESLTCVWGGSTKRKEEEAILRIVRKILESHLHFNPKDKLWSQQLAKVKNAEATMSF